jgi:hypothetical protein
MPNAIADPSCNLLFSSPGIEQSQSLDPDPFSPPARDAGGRFATGSSGNPRGRPRGIANPKRRVPDLVARPLSAQALSNLLDRKPYLLSPLAAQLMSPLAAIDPAVQLGIRLLFIADSGRFSTGAAHRLGGRFPRRDCPRRGCAHYAAGGCPAARVPALGAIGVTARLTARADSH